MKRILSALGFMLSVLITAMPVQAAEYQIEVRVTQLESDKDANPDWPVYVYAAVPGSRVPLSSARVSLKDLPATVMLDETMYVLPQFTLKGVEEIELVAKLSTSGDPHKKGEHDRVGRSPVIAIRQGTAVQTEVMLQP